MMNHLLAISVSCTAAVKSRLNILHSRKTHSMSTIVSKLRAKTFSTKLMSTINAYVPTYEEVATSLSCLPFRSFLTNKLRVARHTAIFGLIRSVGLVLLFGNKLTVTRNRLLHCQTSPLYQKNDKKEEKLPCSFFAFLSCALCLDSAPMPTHENLANKKRAKRSYARELPSSTLISTLFRTDYTIRLKPLHTVQCTHFSYDNCSTFIFTLMFAKTDRHTD